MKRVIGVDYGRRRVGVAVSDDLGLTAQPLATLTVRGGRDASRQLVELVDAHDVDTIVVGLPLNMDGTRGEMADEVEKLGGRLAEETGRPVIYWDERLTTQAASRTLRMSGKRADKGAVDRIAACLILDGYLNSKRA
ncbi:MAG: Holliday junction resolvase RuvX [Gemmatimonadetes bacterium]|nr:Holliday junction resolvase RuvX [Gemmatimonadota bacterium]